MVDDSQRDRGEDLDVWWCGGPGALATEPALRPPGGDHRAVRDLLVSAPGRSARWIYEQFARDPKWSDAESADRLAAAVLAGRLAGAHMLADVVLEAARASGVPLEWPVRWAVGADHPPQATLVGHTDCVDSVAIGAAGGRPVIVSGGADRTVRIWDMTAGVPAGAPLLGHTDRVLAVAVADVDGRGVVASGGKDGTVRIWDVASGGEVDGPPRRHDGAVNSVAMGEIDGRAVVVSGGSDYTVRIWDASTGRPVREPLSTHVDVQSVAIATAGGRTLIAAGGNGSVYVWDAVTSASITRFAAAAAYLTTVAIADIDGRAVVISGTHQEDEVRVWDVAAGDWSGDALRLYGEGVLYVGSAHIDGRAILVAAGEKGRATWDAVTREPVRGILDEDCDLQASAVMGDIDGQPVFVWTEYGNEVQVAGVSSGVPVGQLPPFHDHVEALAPGNLDGRAVVVSIGSEGTVRWWDTATSEPVGTTFRIGEHGRRLLSAVYGEVAGRPVIVSGAGSGTVRIWDARTGAPVGEPLGGPHLAGHQEAVFSVAMGEVAGRPVIVSGSSDGTVRVWDAASGAPVGEPLPGHEGGVPAVVTAQVDGRTVIVSGGFDGTVRVWDAASGAPVGEPLRGHESHVLALATGRVDGRTVILSGGLDATVRIWDATSGEQTRTPLRFPTPVSEVCFADADRIVVATDDALFAIEVQG